MDSHLFPGPRYSVLLEWLQTAEGATWEGQAFVTGRITFIMCSAALEQILLEDAKMANWGYTYGAEKPDRNLKFIDCGGLSTTENVTVKRLLSNLDVMLNSVPNMFGVLRDHANNWIADATRGNCCG